MSAKLTIFEHISLDGGFQRRGSGEDTDFPYGDGTAPLSHPRRKRAILAACGDRFNLLLGRPTYDIWSGFRPNAPASPMSDRLNSRHQARLLPPPPKPFNGACRDQCPQGRGPLRNPK